MPKRRFELVEGASAKFWEIEVKKKTVTVRFGRLGTAGQTKDKEHPSAEAAARDAEKLVREKTGKGYTEVGDAKVETPKAKADAPANANANAPKKDAAPVTTVPFPTGKFGWTEGIDALFEKGFPYLRILTEEKVAPKAAIRQAKKARQDVDPYLQVHIPRAVGICYLAGYPFQQYEDEASMLAAMADPPPIDVALLRRCLAMKYGQICNRSETYDFRMAEVLFLFEAFLGAEVVLAEAVAHLVAWRDHPERWGEGMFVDHENAPAARMISMLGWFRFRIPEARYRASIAPLAGEARGLPKFAARLQSLVDDEAPAGRDGAEFGMQRRSEALLRRRIERFPYWEDPQFYFVLGKDELLRADVKKLKQEPKWQQLRWLEEFGVVRAAGTARMMAALLESRSVGKEAAAWLDARRDWVEREALPELEKADPKAAGAIKAHFGGAAVVPAAKSEKQLEAELEKLLDGVGTRLKAVAGDTAKEQSVLTETFAHYAEIRAALGDESPDAYFTHQLGDRVPSWKVPKETSMRWMDMAVEVPFEP
jgi:predicted DNA-binding WGR domain protein